MHELSITEAMLNVVLEEAEKNHAIRVRRVHIAIGAMTGVVDESVRFYFELLSEGTPAQGAELFFSNIAAKMRCRQCEARFALQPFDLTCPECGHTELEIVEGKELFIKSIEVDHGSESPEEHPERERSAGAGKPRSVR